VILSLEDEEEARVVTPEMASPFRLVGRGHGRYDYDSVLRKPKHQVWEWTIEADIDNLPRSLPKELRQVPHRIEVQAGQLESGERLLLKCGSFLEYQVGTYQRLRPVLVAIARIIKRE